MKTLVKMRFVPSSPRLRTASAIVPFTGDAAYIDSPDNETWCLLEGDVTRVELKVELLSASGMRVEGSHTVEEFRTFHCFRDVYRVERGRLMRDADAELPARAYPTSSLDLRSLVRVVAPGAHDDAHGAASIVTFDVDVSFVDVTSRMPQEIAWGDTDGCAVRIYEYTGGEGGSRCTALAVVIPPALRHGRPLRAIDSLLFFGPPGYTYGRATDVSLGQLKRYIEQRPGPHWGFRHQPDEVTRTEDPDPWPPCRFARQLAESGRRVMFVMPQGNGASFSPFDNGAWTRTGAAPSHALLDSLIKAVQSDGHLVGGVRGSRVGRGRVGVAGFSLGGEHALECFHNNTSRVDELYLFDPNRFGEGSSNQRAVRDWARTPGRRLRLIGGMHAASMIAFARELSESLGGVAAMPDGNHDRRPDPLSSDPSVMVLPTSELFFYRSRDYQSAFMLRERFRLSSPGDANESRLSRDTGIHALPVSPGDPEQLVLTLPDGTTTEPEPMPGWSHDELIMELYDVGCFEHRITTARRFAHYLHAVRATSHPPGRNSIPLPAGRRHQWTVFGGQGATGAHDATFRGYLQICLETSGFAR